MLIRKKTANAEKPWQWSPAQKRKKSYLISPLRQQRQNKNYAMPRRLSAETVEANESKSYLDRCRSRWRWDKALSARPEEVEMEPNQSLIPDRGIRSENLFCSWGRTSSIIQDKAERWWRTHLSLRAGAINPFGRQSPRKWLTIDGSVSLLVRVCLSTAREQKE